MSKSRKKNPASTVVNCKSQKKDKRLCNRAFRRKSKTCIKTDCDLPYRTRKIMNVYNFAGDGKCYWGFDCKCIEEILRK